MEISGIIQSGAGKGAFFTQVDWVVRQCEKMLGYRPFPGTLNVRIDDSDMNGLKRLVDGNDFELVPDDPAFCSASVKKVVVNGIPAAVVIPAEDVRIHEERIVEIIAACGIKETLGLKDGDGVRLSWGEAPTGDRTTAVATGKDQREMHKEIYAFAASAGALEGYAYPRQELTGDALDNWIGNLVKQYHHLPEDVREAFQSALDRTLGRAVQALIPVLGADHAHIHSLSGLIAGEMPSSPHDFEKEKAEKAAKYGK
jgi:riboflavin kinase